MISLSEFVLNQIANCDHLYSNSLVLLSRLENKVCHSGSRLGGHEDKAKITNYCNLMQSFNLSLKDFGTY